MLELCRVATKISEAKIENYSRRISDAAAFF